MKSGQCGGKGPLLLVDPDGMHQQGKKGAMSPLQDASTCSQMSCSTHSAKGHANGMVLVAGGSKVSIFEAHPPPICIDSAICDSRRAHWRVEVRVHSCW